MAIVVALFFEIGFPFFIIHILNENSHQLYSPEVKKKFGSLYNSFKDSPRDNKFIVIVLLKQFFYSIVINISEHLTILQNSFLLVVNLVFMGLLVSYSPYEDNIYYIQATVMSISTVLIVLLNFGIIIQEIPYDIRKPLIIVSAVIQILTFSGFLIIQILTYCKKRRELQFRTQEPQNERTLEHGNNPLFKNEDYIKISAERHSLAVRNKETEET